MGLGPVTEALAGRFTVVTYDPLGPRPWPARSARRGPAAPGLERRGATRARRDAPGGRVGVRPRHQRRRYRRPRPARPAPGAAAARRRARAAVRERAAGRGTAAGRVRGGLRRLPRPGSRRGGRPDGALLEERAAGSLPEGQPLSREEELASPMAISLAHVWALHRVRPRAGTVGAPRSPSPPAPTPAANSCTARPSCSPRTCTATSSSSPAATSASPSTRWPSPNSSPGRCSGRTCPADRAILGRAPGRLSAPVPPRSAPRRTRCPPGRRGPPSPCRRPCAGRRRAWRPG